MKEFNLTRLFSVSVLAVVALSLTVFGQTPAPATAPGGLLVYFGTYTTGKYTSKGVYVSRLDTTKGTLTPPQLAAEASSPSFLAVHPTGNFIYSVNEVNTFDGKTSGAVSAFAVDRSTGLLKALNQQPSVGAGPAHLTVDKDGRNVLVANYGGGSVAVLPLEKSGKLKSPSAFVQHTGSSVNPQRQKEPHAHSINLDPTNRYAFVADLGLDKVLIYKFDPAKGLLTLNEPSSASVRPGSGPRHLAFNPNGRFAFVINEMTCTITAFSLDSAKGELREVHNVSALPPGETVKQGQSGAEIQVHPSGKFLYASIRGLDSIAVFGTDPYSGRLTYIQSVATQGNTPRGFGIDPDGGYLLVGNQNSGTVVVFRIDPQSGKLTPTGSKIEISAPVSVKFVR
jgi:6-phosphogluconolactonase